MRRRRGNNNNNGDDSDDSPSGSIRIRFDGCEGNVQDGAYRGWFGAESIQWGVGRGVGFGDKREMSSCSVSEMTLTATYDAHWAFIYGLSMAGAVFPVVTIALVTKRTTSLFRITEVVISGFSFSSGGNEGSISLSLNFVAVDMSTTTIVRAPISVPSTLQALEQAKQIGTALERVSRDPLYKVFAHLSQKDLYNAALSCKLFLFAASHPSLLRNVTNQSLYHLKIGDKRVGINGYRAPKGLLASDEEGGGRRHRYGGDEEEETEEQKAAKKKLEQETIEKMGLKELTREVKFPRHLFVNEDL